jgi:hypothetical protein
MVMPTKGPISIGLQHLPHAGLGRWHFAWAFALLSLSTQFVVDSVVFRHSCDLSLVPVSVLSFHLGSTITSCIDQSLVAVVAIVHFVASAAIAATVRLSLSSVFFLYRLSFCIGYCCHGPTVYVGFFVGFVLRLSLPLLLLCGPTAIVGFCLFHFVVGNFASSGIPVPAIHSCDISGCHHQNNH